MDGSNISASDKRKRVIHQIERGESALEKIDVSVGDLNAWSSAAELLITQLQGSESPLIRGLRNARTRIPANDHTNPAAMNMHRQATLENQIKVLESLAASLQYEVENAPTGQPTDGAAGPGDSKVILTWSGKTSRAIASFLYEWLPMAIPGLVPWISTEDIAKGNLWFPELMAQLGRSPACIICVTPENYRAPWVYYEAGVIAAKKEKGKIYTVLFGVSAESIKSTPLEQFQATEADKKDVWRLIKTIDGRLPNGPHDSQAMQELYEQHWPTLKKEIDEALTHSVGTTESAATIDILSQYGLSDDAKEILREACKDSGGSILFVEHDGGLDIQTNNRTFVEAGAARSQARWKAAFDALVRAQLIEDVGRLHQVFRVTHEGYKVADML